MSGSKGDKESLDLKQTERRNGGSRRLDVDATADRADWKPSAKLFNPHSRPGPDQQNAPGNWRLDTPDVFPSSSHSVCEISDNVCVCVCVPFERLCLTSDLMVKTPYWSPGVLWTSNLDHLQQRFTYYKHLSDELWQLVGVQIKP